MAGPRPGSFPLLVRGDWGTAEPPAALRKKLLLYFQSPKRSGGGECELRWEAGRLLVCFAQPDVSRRVLDRPAHELEWGPRGKLSLLVTALPEEEDSRSPQEPPAEPEAPADEPVPSVPTPAEQDAVPHPQPPAAGTGLSPQRPPPQEAPPEVHELGAQEASQWEHPSAERTELVVKPGEMETAPEPCQVENPEVSLPSPLMVLENVRENVSSYMLTMLVENISDLSEEDGNFSVEMIPELRAAVVTFTGNAATADIVKKLNQSERAKKQNLTAHLLELTNCIRAENIPPNTPSDYISIYFENKKNGGAQVANVFQQHEEGAAIIKFKDHRDVNNVLSKQHSLNGTPISVYPYYASLGTALYGKEGPQIKQPDPVTVPLDPYIWRFLQRKNSLIEAIRSDMANCNCEITWPRGNCAEPKVILHPSAALSERKRSVAQLVRTWNTVASTTFSYSISKYRVEKLKVSAEVWKAIRTSINHSELLMIPFTSKDLLLVVGHKDILKTVVRELNLLIEKVTREIEREKQTTEEIVMLSPGDFAILQSIGLEERIRLEFPALQITYDHFQQIINLCGLREEVYKVKGEILVNMQKMTKKSVTLHPFVFQFLQRIDNETLSQSLFLSKHISAFYELGPDAVLLKGNDDENLLKAEEELKKELDYKSIALEDESILQKEEWTALTEENCCNAAVTVIQKEGEIIVAGFSQAVAKAFEELFNFVDENTQVQKVIGGKPTVVLMYIKEEKTSVLDDLKNKGVKIDFNKVISLRGPRREVLKGTTLIEQMLSGLHYKRVVINEPGARSYLKERVRFFADSVKNEFNCLIRLEEQPEEYPEEQREHSNVGKCYTQMTVHGVLIAVYKADLCTHHVDVVVNASNEDLKHIGGLAWALLQAAGPELQAECDGVVRMSGSLQAGDAVITGAGKLPCKQVIHAVGPRWKEQDAEKCVYLLKKTIKKSLQLAETYNHRSIAFPSVSGGIFGFPPHKCVNAIVSAIKKTLEEFKRDSSLKEIHLVAVDEETVRVLRETVQKEFTAKSSSSVLQQQCSPNHRQGESQREKRGDDLSMATGGENMITTAEGLRIQVEKKDIIDATTDVIVNSVGTDLKFGVGPLCRALLKEAGPELQMEFDKEKGQQVAGNGSVVCTKGYTLDCTFVFHAVLPQWDRGSGQALKTLENTVHKCLMKAEEFGLKSIAFPAIGTGGFSFPHTVVSKLMFDEVFKFSRCQSRKTLQEVHFVLHPNDRQNIQAFTSELKCRVTGKYCGAAPQPDFISPVSIEASGAYTMRIGSVTLKVTSGDITKEDTEVIVNIANQTFDATSGVFKAIMDAAGFDVKEECNQYGGLLQSGFITTKGGALLCRRIIHLIHSMNVKNQVSEVLHECQLRTYKSVAFPAIGTGAAQQSPAKVADDMLDAIVEFVSSRSVPHLKEIRIIIFQKHMLRDFLQSMKKREDPGLFEPPQSRMSTPKSCFWGPKKSIEKKKLLALEKKVDTVTFQICGESQKNVDATESWIIDVILKEQLENRIVDDVIENFDERQTEALADLQRGKHVTIKLEKNHSPPCITISGINRDVCSVFVEVQKMIQKKKAAQEEQSKAELIYKLVGWKYQKSDDSFVAFDKLTNMQLEDARLCKKPHLTVKINKTIYKVDLNTLQAHDDQGRTINIQREPKNGDMQSIENPAKWEAMQGEQVKLVTLARSCQEYLEVQKKFQKTAHNFVIEQIQRIQNPFLWQSYQIKKKSLCMKNKNQDNEKLLFHGTAKSSLSTINYNGFNRGFAGMHAASIGKGTYFAVDAIYSADDTYSRPDMSGRKYMYLVRVLTGEFCVGSRELVAAPPKHSADPTDLYDSVVDDVNAPNMFVIFNDIQAYPEYLITFRR